MPEILTERLGLLDADLGPSMGSPSRLGIEILVVRARIVVAGVDTFLRYAAALGLAGPPALVAAQPSIGK